MFLAWILAAGFAGPAIGAEDLAPARTYEDLEFAHPSGKRLLLDLVVPGGPQPPPLVVYIHGGSWISGSRKSNPVRWLTEHGFAVASISYRFSSDAAYPAQIHDCKAAIRWLRSHAAEYGCDGSRIGVIGSSAGAHLAVLLGTAAGVPELEGPAGDEPGGDSRVQAVVDFFGATDFFLRAETQPSKTNPPGSPVFQLLGSSPAENPALARLASGALLVTPDDAPLRIYHGEKDRTVLPDQSRRIEQAYRDAGIEVALRIYPDAGHAMKDFLDEATKAEIVAFLHRHLNPPVRDDVPAGKN